MKFPFGNNIPFAIVTELKGKRRPVVLFGIPGDMEFKPYCNGEKDNEKLAFLIGTKKGSRPICIAVYPPELAKAHEEKQDANT